MNIQRVGVVGAGTMGNGIAHVFARAGYNVVLCDVEQRFVDRGMATIGKNLDREIAKDKISGEEKAAAIKRIEPTVDREKLADRDFVVEAATEKFDIKSELFRDLDRLCQPEIILASNTSSISITKLAALTKRPDKSHRNAFLQSGTGHETGGSPFAAWLRRMKTFQTVRDPCGKAGKDTSRGQRRSGLRLQSCADATAERSHVRGDGRRCDGRSCRRSI